MSNPKRQKYSLEQANSIVQNYYDSGKSLECYCKEHNFNIGTFNWWLCRYRKGIQANKSTNIKSKQFIKLTPQAHHRQTHKPTITIDFANGTRIRVDGASSYSEIANLILTVSAQR